MTAREPSWIDQPARTPAPVPDEAPAQGRSPATLAVRVALPWVIQLRFVLLAGEAVLLVVLGSTGHASVSPAWALIPIGLQLLSNFWLMRHAARSKTSAQHSLGFIFALDTLALTAIFAATGGPANPFTLLYLVQITLSAVILHKAWTWTLGALSTLGYGSLFWVAASVPGHAAHEPADAMAGHLLGMWIAFTLAAGVITFFIGTVSETLRRRQKEILNLQHQVARQDRLASLVTLAAGAAHEMGTPLGTIAIAAHEIERAAGQDVGSELSADARLIREQVERCREILARMSARGGEPLGEAPRRIEPKELLARVKETLPEALRDRLIIETPLNLGSVELPVEAAAQALSALVKNGLDASADGGSVSVTVSAGEGEIRFAVSDFGEGMDAATLARVAEPFFTRKPAGKGMGLGAFLAHLFATRMGGSLTYDSVPGKGTTAMLNLPVHVQ
jgi:two-component system, sensor histidine kinase RegB